MVPKQTVPKNKSVHTLVMTRPTGKIPKVLPGSMNLVAFAGVLVAEGLVDIKAGLDPEVAGKGTWSAKTPATKEVLSVDKFASSDLPLLALPERVMVGAR